MNYLCSYTEQEDYSQYTNILFIDSTVYQSATFVNGVSSNTFPIVYSHHSNRKPLEDFIVNKLSHISKIGFVFHGLAHTTAYPNINMFCPRLFLENDVFFTDEDIQPGATTFSENILFLRSLFDKLTNLTRLDFLGCNLLQYDQWKTFFDVLKNGKSDLIIGASNDDTGNIQYGGNWVMENTLENIKSVYFTSLIDNYSDFLANQYITLDDNGISRTWGYDDYWKRLISCSNHTGTVNVPRIVNSLTMIGMYETFLNSSVLSSVVIPNGMTQANFAFSGCSKLSDYTFPSTMVECQAMFKGTAITSFTVDNRAWYSRYDMFENCTKLTSLTYTEGVTGIGWGCEICGTSSLTSLTIPNSVNNLFLTNRNGYDDTLIGCYLQTITFGAQSVLKDINIRGAQKLLSIDIPNTVTSLTDFNYLTSLTSITIPSTCRLYGSGSYNGTLQNCWALKSIVLPNTLTSQFPNNLLAGSNSLTSLTWPPGLTQLGYQTLNGTGLTSLTIPNGITRLDYVLQPCWNLTNLIAPNVTYMNIGPIGVSSYRVPDNVTFASFYNWTNLTSITFGTNSQLAVEGHQYQFARTKIRSIKLPYGMTTLTSRMFWETQGLTELYVPDTMIYNGYYSLVGSDWTTGGLYKYNANNVVYKFIGTWDSGGNTNFDTVVNIPVTNTSTWKFVGEQLALPDPSGNALAITTISTLNLTDTAVIGTTVEAQRTFTKSLISGLFKLNGAALSNKVVTLENVTLPGFAPVKKVVVFNSSTTTSTNFTNALDKTNIVGNNFYVLMENANDKVTIPSMNSSVTVTKTGTSTFSINNGITIKTQNSGTSYSFDGLTINLGSVLGYLVDPATICFKDGTKILCLSDDSEEVEILVEDLRVGMLVKTYKHGYIPISLVGTKVIYNPGNDTRMKERLYTCSTENYPELTQDLIITGCHSILVDALTEEQTAKTLEDASDIFITDDKYRLMCFLDDRSEPYMEEGTYSIYHITLEHHDDFMNYGIYANGLLVESCSKRSMIERSYMKISQ